MYRFWDMMELGAVMRRLPDVVFFVFVLLHLYRAADNFLRTESQGFVFNVLLNKRSIFRNGIFCANAAFDLFFECVSIPCLVPPPVLHDGHVCPQHVKRRLRVGTRTLKFAAE